MNRSLPIALFVSFLLSPVASFAQTRIHAGFAMGGQTFASADQSPRVLTSAEILMLRETVGFQMTVEYADSPAGAIIVTHPNAVYRKAFATDWFGLLGAGPTFASVGSLGHRTTWNVEGEVGRRWGRNELFARVRQYEFSLRRFREGEAGPSGPAIYLGYRFALTK